MSTNTSNTLLQKRAMLVGLTIRQWSARKHDKRITNDVAVREKASADAGRYNKRLLPKEALAFMQSAATAMRLEHYKRTLPWSDDGQRILSSQGYFDYINKMRVFKTDFERAADDFAEKYMTFVQQAQSTLGHLYNEADYPTPDKIRSKFAIEVRVLPMPSQEDFRASLPDEDIQSIREDIEKQVSDAILIGQRDVYQRITDCLGHMVSKLREYTPGTEDARPKGIFRDSLVGNVRDLAELLPSLNITDSSDIDMLKRQLDELTEGITAQDLRLDETLRGATADTAQDILDKVQDFLA